MWFFFFFGHFNSKIILVLFSNTHRYALLFGNGEYFARDALRLFRLTMPDF